MFTTEAAVGSTAGGLLVLGLLLLSFYMVRRLVLPRLETLRSFCYRSSTSGATVRSATALTWTRTR